MNTIKFTGFEVDIRFNKKFERYEGLHRAINPKTGEPLQKFGFDFDSLFAKDRTELEKMYYSKLKIEVEKVYLSLEKKVMYADSFEQKNKLKKDLFAKFDELQNLNQLIK
jgi:hypothetical protein